MQMLLMLYITTRGLLDLLKAYFLLSLVPRRGGGGGESAWYTLFAHAHNYSKSRVVQLGACTKAPFTRTNPGYFNPD